MTGAVRAQFSPTGQIMMLEINATDHTEMIPRKALVDAASESPEMKLSPSLNKSQAKRGNQQGKQKQPAAPPPREGLSLAPVPKSSVNFYGITNKVQTFCEVSTASRPTWKDQSI